MDRPQTVAQPIKHGADRADRRQLPFPVAFSKQCLAYSLGGEACVGQGRLHLRVCLTVGLNQRADIPLQGVQFLFCFLVATRRVVIHSDDARVQFVQSNFDTLTIPSHISFGLAGTPVE